MNAKFLFFLAFILLFAAFLFFARKGKYDQFHNANIKDKIDTLYRYRDCVMIYIDGVEYRIIPVSVSGNEFSFDDVARKGDSLIKPAGHDTLIIKRAGDIVTNFLYTVKRH